MLRRIAVCSKNLINFKRVRLSMAVNRPLGYQFSTKGNFKNINTKYKPDQEFKQQSKQFYQNHVEKITQLKSSGQLQKLILSIKDPIVLDLYADWCEPCKKLTPRLEEKVNSLQNVKLIKVNIDKCPQIAHALQVKSVPTVYLLFQGQAVDKIQGNVGQKQFNKFFDNISKITGISNQAKQAIQILQKAKQAMGGKKFQEGAQILQNQFKQKQKKITNDLVAIKQLLLTQCYLSLGKASKCKDSLSRASQYQSFIKQAPELNKFYQILKAEVENLESQAKQDPQLQKLHDKIQKSDNPQSKLQSKFQLFQYLKSKQMTENALEIAMQIIKQDKNWQDKKTNKQVLNIFKQLGNNSPVVQKYRKILQRLLS